jgi:hypothetical protein
MYIPLPSLSRTTTLRPGQAMAASIAVSGTCGGGGTTALAGEGSAVSRAHEASAGRISDATRPGAVRAAAAASAARDSACGEVRTQWLNGHAVPSMSEVRGAS